MSNESRVFRVSEINEAVSELLRDQLPALWVEGELVDWKPWSSGFVYFTIKEGASAQLSCVMRPQFVRGLPAGVELKAGLAVIVFGTLSIYTPRGQFQMQAQRVQPKGLGAAEEALRRLKEKLLALGYFSPARKRPLPEFPRRVAVITSGTGAAVRDVLAVFALQAPLVEIVVVPVRVQGETAAAEIAEAIARLDQIQMKLPLDAIIVGRGGGSAEDLNAFNDERVATAIFKCTVPVISAVGHEIDVLISDQVADVRAATPTHAAELLSEAWAQLPGWLADSRQRLVSALTRQAGRARERLIALEQRRVFRFPLERLREKQQRLDELEQRSGTAFQRLLERKRALVQNGAGRLAALSPLNVLARGYSLTQTGDRAILRDANTVAPGEIIITRLHRGRLTSKVITIDADDTP